MVSQTGLQHYGYQHRVLMTGTPLQNNTQELWSLLHYIEPTKFPDLERFNERYGKVETVEQVQQLQKRLEPHLLRRTKEDVATDIPAKEETIIDGKGVPALGWVLLGWVGLVAWGDDAACLARLGSGAGQCPGPWRG